MKLHRDIDMGFYHKGPEVHWVGVYLFFFVHLAIIVPAVFVIAYGERGNVAFLYLFGGFMTFLYLVFYREIFGIDQLKWMFINASLGLFGIYAEIEWILALFNKQAIDFTWKVHFFPFSLYILSTFLIRQAVLYITGVRDNPHRAKIANIGYVCGSIAIYSFIFFTQR